MGENPSSTWDSLAGRHTVNTVEVSHLELPKLIKTSRCVTRMLLLSLLTTDPECARLDSPEMTLPELSSPPSLVAPVTRVSWSVWDRRTPMLETRPSPREVSSP